MLLSVFLFFKAFFFMPEPVADVPASIYDFKMDGLAGGTIDFSQYKGKKILIVNTAIIQSQQRQPCHCRHSGQ
jgi:glutathione peroxidase